MLDGRQAQRIRQNVRRLLAVKQETVVELSLISLIVLERYSRLPPFRNKFTLPISMAVGNDRISVDVVRLNERRDVHLSARPVGGAHGHLWLSYSTLLGAEAE